MSKNEDIEVVEGSGNAFRDLGLPNPEINQAKAKLAACIIGILDDNELSVRAAEKLTGVPYSDFSRIRNVDLGRFSLERLIKILTALDSEAYVQIDVHSNGKQIAQNVQPSI